MAVAGLPHTQPRHAVIVAQFAKDCRNKMMEITEELSLKLGSDTKELLLRCGLHSGPTTGKY